MRPFIWTVAVVLVVRVLLAINYLADHKYPRAKPITAGMDAIGLVLDLGFLVWTAYLLFGVH